jgi:hypothetical protein
MEDYLSLLVLAGRSTLTIKAIYGYFVGLAVWRETCRQRLFDPALLNAYLYEWWILSQPDDATELVILRTHKDTIVKVGRSLASARVHDGQISPP